jgi:hypothetical protein
MGAPVKAQVSSSKYLEKTGERRTWQKNFRIPESYKVVVKVSYSWEIRHML